jgi:atypical dual specificity phosphatase
MPRHVIRLCVFLLSATTAGAQTVIVSPSYSKVEDGLYVGGMVATPPDVKAVLNVCEVKDAYAVKFSKFSPIKDSRPAPSLDWLKEQVAFVDEHRKADRAVFVHCAVGMSRSGMVVIAYLMQRDGLTRDQALKVVKAKRELVQPNPSFMDLLADWEAELTKGKKK